MQDSVWSSVQPSHERVGNTGRFGSTREGDHWRAVLGKLATRHLRVDQQAAVPRVGAVG